MRYTESANAVNGVVVRRVAAVLQDETTPERAGLPYRPGWIAHLGRLPDSWIRRLAARFVRQNSQPASLAFHVKADELAAWNVSQYDSLPPDRRFETIVLGVPSGATAHLCSCLNAPFLSHTFVAGFRQRCDPDDVLGYYHQGQQLARPILDHNPNLHVVNHYDPVHQRLVVDQVNRIHLKHLRLPIPYTRFIRERLAPGGTLLLLDCTANWGQYAIGPRHRFQVGSASGITDREYIHGSRKLDTWLAQQGSRIRGGWQLSLPWNRQPESNWGLQPEFAGATGEFAREHDIPLRIIHFPRVEDFSKLAFYAWQWLYYLQETQPLAVLVASGLQITPSAPRRSRVLPLWLPSNTLESRAFLHSMAGEFPADVPVLFQPWPCFSPGPDIARPQDWHRALHGLYGAWLGADPLRYPADLAALSALGRGLDRWLQRHPAPVQRHLHFAEFEMLLAILAESARLPLSNPPALP